MAVAVGTVTKTGDFVIGNLYKVIGTVAVGAGPLTYATGGITMSFAGTGIKAQRAPVNVLVTGQAAQAGQTQYEYTFVPGTDATNGLLKAFTGGAEVAAGAVPSGVSGDTIQFEATFKGML